MRNADRPIIEVCQECIRGGGVITVDGCVKRVGGQRVLSLPPRRSLQQTRQ